MISTIRCAVLAAIVGALAGALSLAGAYASHPALAFEMDRPLPSFFRGIYDGERDALGTFAWTSGRVDVSIPGIDRHVAWSCTIRFRGARAEGAFNPTMSVDVDGRPAANVAATNEFQDLAVALPPDTATGTSIVMNVTPTFVPGGADKRVLGVQLDRFECRPSSKLVRPPSNALAPASLAVAIFGAGLALLGLSLSGAMLAAAVAAVGQTAMMTLSSGLYGSYPGRLPWLALGVSLSTLVLARAIEWWRRQALSVSARFVLASSACALFLKLVGLFHPAKAIVDALFHAHRLDWVLAGTRFFTQPMPNGVEMPYAIGLYVFAAPWAWVSADHVRLLWTVTASVDVIAGALLYPVVLRAWGDRRVAALAAVLFQFVPLSYVTLGNANLTNIFGQSMALVTLAAATTWRLDPRRVWSLTALAALTAWSLCSHVSTATTLPATLGTLVVLYFWRGDPDRRRAALGIVLATVIALAFSWFAYYSHFSNVFRDAFTLMFSEPRTAEIGAAAVVKGNMTMVERVRNVLQQAIGGAGWPLLLLSCLGVWCLARRRRRDRLTPALLAWVTVWAVFSGSTAFARVDAAYVRYTAEFLGRINLATIPLLAILAARGAAFGWDPETPESIRRPLQVAATILTAWAFVGAVQAWLGWF